MAWIKDIYENMDKDLLGILITILIGFIAWVYKKLLESPMQNARETFFKYSERRIEALSQICNLLLAIAFFPNDKELKEKLKKFTLTSDMGYLDERENNDIIKLAYAQRYNEELLIDIIRRIKQQLAKQINKINSDNLYYAKYSNSSQLKKMVAGLILCFKSVLSLSIILLTLYLLILLFSSVSSLSLIILFAVILIIILFFIDKFYLKK